MFGITKDEPIEEPVEVQELVEEPKDIPFEVENPKKIIVESSDLPICPVCRFELEAVRYTDYGDICVVHHTSGRCVIGTITKP